MPELITIPDDETITEMAAYFEHRWGLPYCVGAVDGSHAPILAPQNFHTDYFNCNGWHSIIFQVVIEGHGTLWNVFAGLPGSLHDALVLRLSTIWQLTSQGNLFPKHTTLFAGYYIPGVTAYPLQEWLLKTFTETGRLI